MFIFNGDFNRIYFEYPGQHVLNENSKPHLFCGSVIEEKSDREHHFPKHVFDRLTTTTNSPSSKKDRNNQKQYNNLTSTSVRWVMIKVETFNQHTISIKIEIFFKKFNFLGITFCT